MNDDITEDGKTKTQEAYDQARALSYALLAALVGAALLVLLALMAAH